MDNNDFLDDNIPQQPDTGSTQEMDSISEYQSDYSEQGIMPRERFTDLNSTDDTEKTRLMDSVAIKGFIMECDNISAAFYEIINIFVGINYHCMNVKHKICASSDR